VGQRAAVGSPANCNGAIAVSALDARKQITPYSNTGAQIAVAAPGGDASQSTTGNGAADAVYSDLATFDANGKRVPAFGGLQGTSMASPHVAGVMALMRYVNPALTVAQVDTLLANGDLTEDLGTAGRDIDFGFGLIDARKAVNAALAAAGTPAPAPTGRVVASPSSIDFGSFQSSGVLELVANAASTEALVSISSDNAAVTVVPTSVDAATKLGRYTVNVNRAALGVGSFFPKLTVTLAPARSLTVQLSITVPGGAGTTTNADYGPMYVLLFNPDNNNEVVATVLATHSGGKYTWSLAGYTLGKVAIAAGGDLDNDNLICQRGEPCGAYPVLAPGRDLTVITLTADRNDLNFEAAPLSGISAQSTGAGNRTAWRKGVVLRGAPTPAK
jgi:serine protease